MKKPKVNLALSPHAPEVGRRVCLGCVGNNNRTRFGTAKFKPWPHSFVEGACGLKAPGIPRVPAYEPGELEYLDHKRKFDREVPF